MVLKGSHKKNKTVYCFNENNNISVSNLWETNKLVLIEILIV